VPKPLPPADCRAVGSLVSPGNDHGIASTLCRFCARVPEPENLLKTQARKRPISPLEPENMLNIGRLAKSVETQNEYDNLSHISPSFAGVAVAVCQFRQHASGDALDVRKRPLTRPSGTVDLSRGERSGVRSVRERARKKPKTSPEGLIFTHVFGWTRGVPNSARGRSLNPAGVKIK
jgi:hypothetical protein